ncbi:aspartate aminotransferase family protein [Pseudonocardia acaciae]|uniref:aminotransferase family protein n=1 Tax=Pseudonocardia acaciae TaxID=551276 RepID=UPI00048F8EBC|nr:aspartate aminotransferase family protein [Pseudonocardia acaciae]
MSERTPEDLAGIDRAHLIHPYLPASTRERVVMVRGEGSRLWDAGGREYLDATGGLWLAQVGHGRRELAEVAGEQMSRLEYFTSFWEFSNDRAIALAQRLVSLAPAPLDHVYFTSGGSEGNEAAIKMARYYHHRRGEGSRTWILGRHRAYHGIGYGGGSVSGFPLYHEGFGPMMPHVRHLTPPWPYRTELYEGQDCTDYCIAELERTIAEIGPENIAAMLGEPIMGVAGMVVPPADYWPRVAEVLRRHGILLILDEVVTAYGRVGRWFAAEHFGVTPDIMVTAKGITSGYLPLGAVLVSGEVSGVLGRDHGFPMGYTYNGHPTACAVALANLDIIEREGLLERAVKIGDFLAAELRRCLAGVDVVGEVRNVGMMLGVELVADPATREPLPGIQGIADAIRAEHGVIARDAATALVLSPALTLTEPEAGTIASAIAEVLARTGRDGTVRAGR